MNGRIATLLLCLCLGIVAWQWQLWQGEQGASPAAPSADVVTAEIEWVSEPPASIENVGEEVFKRAFWRRPSAEDRILQAERHEWHDAEGVSRWQWFLIVDPSPALLQYLRDENAFGLVAGSGEPLREAPAWFRFDPQAVQTLRAHSGGMQVSFRASDDRIFACASGAGFTKGAAAPSIAPAPISASSAGRLPNAPPPIPRRAD
jgi:hypothetical protein